MRDFDVSVSFDLLDFPLPPTGCDYASLHLVSRVTGQQFANIDRLNCAAPGPCEPSTKNYKAWTSNPGNCESVIIPTTDDIGGFRITREGSIARIYYWAEAAWVEVRSDYVVRDTAYVVLSAGSVAPGVSFAVRFDNLSACGLCVDPSAIPGSDLPGLRTRGEGVRIVMDPLMPNPSRYGATVRYELLASQEIAVDVFGVRGTTLRRLWKGPASTGRYSVAWDGRDATGAMVPSGVYWIRVRGETGDTRRMIVVVR